MIVLDGNEKLFSQLSPRAAPPLTDPTGLTFTGPPLLGGPEPDQTLGADGIIFALQVGDVDV